MNWYWIFYLISILRNIIITANILWIVSLLLLIVFFIVYLNNKDTIARYPDANNRIEEIWLSISKKIIRMALPMLIIFCTLSIFIPSKQGVFLIIAGGTVGNFIESDEHIKEIPSELIEWMRLELKEEVEQLKQPQTE